MAVRAASAPAQGRRHAARLRVVPGRKTRRRSRSAVPIILVAVLAVFGVAAMQALLGQHGLNASVMERDVQRETERVSLLRARVAQLETPQRVNDEATRLGMVPDPGAVFIKTHGLRSEPRPGRFDSPRRTP